MDISLYPATTFQVLFSRQDIYVHKSQPVNWLLKSQTPVFTSVQIFQFLNLDFHALVHVQ